MHAHSMERWRHSHRFYALHSRGERRTRYVIALTGLMMIVEIAAGLFTRSMALLADGWHMSTHMAALAITAFSYWYARGHADDPRYTFGTGKVGTLGGFASAVFLAVVALLVAGESLGRLLSPLAIRFDEAIAVAVIGLCVNLVSALLLREHQHPDHQEDRGRARDHLHHGHHSNHGHPHDPHHQDRGHHHDHNLRAAYLHVLADALTSLTAIVALLAGKHLGWAWMDPVMGLVGALVIGRWSYGLLRDTSRVLLDARPEGRLSEEIRRAIEADADNRVADLHLWRVGPYHLAAILSVVTHDPQHPDHYKALLSGCADLAHVTVEVIACPAEETVHS